MAGTGGIRAAQRSRRQRVPGTAPRRVAVDKKRSPTAALSAATADASGWRHPRRYYGGHNRAAGAKRARRGWLGEGGGGVRVAGRVGRPPAPAAAPPITTAAARSGARRPRRRVAPAAPPTRTRGPPPTGVGPRCHRIKARGRHPRQASRGATGWRSRVRLAGGVPARRSAVCAATGTAADDSGLGGGPAVVPVTTAKADERRVRFQQTVAAVGKRGGYAVAYQMLSHGLSHAAWSRGKYLIGGEQSIGTTDVTLPPAWRAASDRYATRARLSCPRAMCATDNLSHEPVQDAEAPLSLQARLWTNLIVR